LAGVHHLHQQRAGAVFAVAQFVVEHVHDRQAGVQANQVGQRQRANRVLMPMINEAIFCLHEGIASAGDIDAVMKLGMNHPIGPLALADLIGLDTCLAIMDVLYHELRDSKYRACPLLVQMVDAGQLGRKTAKGFYGYES
jgi:3-hydroxyacyl-CoA dehydrogenase